MNIHEKQRFVTDELTALLRRIDPDIRGATYTESNVRAHVVISYADKPAATIEVAGYGFKRTVQKVLEEI